MTLAAIFFLCIFYLGPPMAAVGTWTPSGQQAPAEVKPAEPSTSSDQTGSQTAAPVAAPNPPPKRPATAKPKSPRQAKKSAPCTPPVASKKLSAAGNSTAKETAGAAAASPSAANLPPCPPPKIIIRNGGTAETAVQLVGGASNGKDSGQRASIDKLLGSTEDSLKKIADLPLQQGQQETVKQIEDYIVQSKAAVASGDLDLAHNLAMKAHLLADELLKPRT